MPQNSPIHPSPFIIHQVAAVPIYHWRGARPYPLSLTADDTGAATCLLFYREGDICPMPVAWEQNLPAHPAAVTFCHADALDIEAFELTLRDLQNDGWQVYGRIRICFTGTWTDPDFYPDIRQLLWQSPSSPGKNRQS
ncbi:MAG TPA: hypothetical protein EYP41_22165 [Anaerolineae bacterium]|nr:hypothetical protein [Anaerolineae bacterium]HIP70620.1 hypothetical protein [Anaerolineae bacterium]